MATRLLDRLRRSLFKDGQGAGREQEEEEPKEEGWEAELEEEEGVTDRLGGTLCFAGGGGTGEAQEADEGEESWLDSESDVPAESMEEGFSSTGEAGGLPCITPDHMIKTKEKTPHGQYGSLASHEVLNVYRKNIRT